MPLIFEPFWKSLAYLSIKEIIVGTAITMLFILTPFTRCCFACRRNRLPLLR